MERFQGIIEKEQEKGEYHHEEIAEMEPSMISLFEQLKDQIDSGKYDTLISDDIGGRIPTLVFRKVLKKMSPVKDINTYFVAAGGYIPIHGTEEMEIFNEHLKKIAKSTTNALVITQYIHLGTKTLNFLYALQENNINNVDLACVVSLQSQERYPDLNEALGNGKLFIGTHEVHREFSEKHEHLSGVRKAKKKYSPYPSRDTDVIFEEGRRLNQKEVKEIMGLTDEMMPWDITEQFNDPERQTEYKRREKVPLTKDEISQMRKNVRDARADVELLSEKIIEQVWGDK